MRPDTPATPADRTGGTEPTADQSADRTAENNPAAEPASEHIADAERLLRTATQYPQDAEQLHLHAAAHLELAGERERATTLYDNLLARTPANPLLIRALKAANLWEYGHEAEAHAIIDGVRSATPRDPAPWVIVAEALESHDELEPAHDTFTEAATRLITPGAPVPQDARPLLVGRHRVRRLLGLAHDDWDALADELHTAPVTLDELHDPNRIWSLGSENPAELRAEIARLQTELGSYRAALSRPFPVAVLHWPSMELAELLAAYPALESEYPSHEEHLTAIESALRELAASGTPNLGIVTATVPSYEAFAAAESTTPTDPSLLPQYTTTLASRGRATPWPPRGECWCGSGVGYGECHGGGTP
ncbi:SEC-C domain-containing protein [Streptomyces triticagri]|uniref:SEC-C domain-containing protein n=1 Tax=Streptomyces triticagri TaxID=2293568 RepID=UPI001F2E01E4|nr:SEC-C domain-containing protein [Streptomyces triticagri]